MPGNVKHEDATRGCTNTRDHYRYTRMTPDPVHLVLPPSPAETLRSTAYHRPTVRRVEFAIELCRGRTTEIMHTYTSIQCVMPSAPRSLDDLKGWRTFYPPLADYFDQGQIECPVFLFDTHLGLMDDFPGCVASVSTENSLDIAQGIHYTDWQSLTRFYEEEGQPVDLAKLAKSYKDPQNGKAWGHLSAFPGTRPTDAKLKVPLKSAWWATTFTKIISQKLKAKAAKDPNAIKIEEENTDRYIRGISVMQEIYASSRSSRSKSERIVILLWKFSTARKGEAATTSWREVVPPMSPFQVQSPTLPQLQPLLTLDSTLENAVVPRSTAPFDDYYSLQQQPSIFASNAEELLNASLENCTSPETTPPSDYASFPSSTSTSFPSNVSSNSCYLSQLSQESSFASQPSLYPSLSSFDSQDSVYHSQQEMMNHSQEVYASQDSIYHSQEQSYDCHQPSTQVYEWPTPQTLLQDDAVTAAHNFIGGKIQLSYPHSQEESGVLPMDYDPHHLLAAATPTAAMKPQHQHHPEHQFSHQDYQHIESDLTETQSDRHHHHHHQQEHQQEQQIDWHLIAEEQTMHVGMDIRLMDGGDVVGPYQQFHEEVGEQGEEVDIVGRGQEQGCVLGEVPEGQGAEEVRPE